VRQLAAKLDERQGGDDHHWLASVAEIPQIPSGGMQQAKIHPAKVFVSSGVAGFEEDRPVLRRMRKRAVVRSLKPGGHGVCPPI